VAIENNNLEEASRIAEEEAFIAELMRIESAEPTYRGAPAHAARIRASADGHVLATLRDGERAWSNRDYAFAEVPDFLVGWQFTRRAGGETATISIDAIGFGRVHVATRTDVEMPQPWTRATGLRFMYNDKARTPMQVWQRTVSPGMRLNIPQFTWTGAIVIAPPGMIER
jgi:hypothetical protein